MVLAYSLCLLETLIASSSAVYDGANMMCVYEGGGWPILARRSIYERWLYRYCKHLLLTD